MARDRFISAIDIGSSKITTVIAKVEEDSGVRVIGVKTMPSKGIKKGQVVNIEEATQAISQSVEAAERMAGTQVQSAYISVGGVHIASLNSHGVVAVTDTDKPITPGDVKRVIESAKAVSMPQSREIMHIIPRGFIIDGQEGIDNPVNMSGVRLEVDTHLITGGAIAIHNLYKCIEDLGIEIAGVVFSGLASSMSVLSDTEKELGVVLVDIGGGTTDIAVYVENALSYSTVIPIGAFHVTKDLAAGLKLDIELAEKLKVLAGQQPKMPVMPDDASPGRQIRPDKADEIDISSLYFPDGRRTIDRKVVVESIIKPRLNEIFNLVGAKIRESGYGGLTPSGIVITGGGALTAAAVEAARRCFAMQVRIGVPRGVTGLIDEITTPEFATSVGLLLYGISGNKHEESSMFGGMGKVKDKIQIKGAAGKLIELVKSFMP